MKPKTFTTGRLLFALMIAGITLALVSWDFKQPPHRYHQPNNDTTPKPKTDKEKKIVDLDDVLDELNDAEFKVNMEKMQQELADAMTKIDMQKMKLDMEKAMKEVDMEKIKRELDESMTKIDMKKIKEEMAEAMKEFDAAKIQEEVEASMKKIDWDKMKSHMDDIKKIDMSKMQLEMEKLQEQMKELGPKLENESKKPLKDVSVTAYLVSKKEKVAVTDEEGNFVFDELKPGTYKFVFEKAGFKRITKEKVVIKTDEAFQLNIEMIESNDIDIMPSPFQFSSVK